MNYGIRSVEPASPSCGHVRARISCAGDVVESNRGRYGTVRTIDERELCLTASCSV